MNPVEQALAKGQLALNEFDAKRFLAGFGIPVCRETLVRDPVEAAAEAATIGFPVALKASGSTLFHKTEVGGIALNLKSQEEVREEAGRPLRIPGCQAVLVQEMIRGDRELVCGLTRDAQLLCGVTGQCTGPDSSCQPLMERFPRPMLSSPLA